jgi:hypothetical protein
MMASEIHVDYGPDLVTHYDYSGICWSQWYGPYPSNPTLRRFGAENVVRIFISRNGTAAHKHIPKWWCWVN